MDNELRNGKKEMDRMHGDEVESISLLDFIDEVERLLCVVEAPVLEQCSDEFIMRESRRTYFDSKRKIGVFIREMKSNVTDETEEMSQT